MNKCMKCGARIAPKSVFARIIRSDGPGEISSDVVRSEFLAKFSCVIHLNGDPNCGKIVSGFIASIAKALDVTDDDGIASIKDLVTR